MPLAYSTDLRWRIIWLRFFKNLWQCVRGTFPGCCTWISAQSNEDSATVPGDLCVIRNPSRFFGELKNELFNATGRDISSTSICRLLSRHKFSRKKIQLVARQRSAAERITFMSQMPAYPQHCMFWIDESGFNQRNAIRRYGYALRGKLPRCQKPLVRGRRVNALIKLGRGHYIDITITIDIRLVTLAAAWSFP